MATAQPPSKLDVIRSTLREDRGEYFVSYGPADSRLPFATINLTFPVTEPNIARVRQAMDAEMLHWLARYNVPVMITAFDVKDDVVPVNEISEARHLMAFVEPVTGVITKRWGLFQQTDLPAEQSDVAYLATIYADLPFRVRDEVRRAAQREARLTGRTLRVMVLLLVGVPVAIEIVALGVTWLGHVLAAISIGAGLWKVAKAMGWRKQSKREAEEAAEQTRMNHYFYHCERHPTAFARLRAENFERETIEATHKEAAELHQARAQAQLAQYAAERLAGIFDTSEAERWLSSRQKLLGDAVPADLIKDGRAAEVLAVIEQLRDSVHT